MTLQTFKARLGGASKGRGPSCLVTWNQRLQAVEEEARRAEGQVPGELLRAQASDRRGAFERDRGHEVEGSRVT